VVQPLKLKSCQLNENNAKYAAYQTVVKEESMNLFKVVPFVLLSMASSANAGTWCVMDEVYSVDTSANTGSHCWVGCYLNVNGTATAISDLSICSNTDAAANARNLALALSAFTANKKLNFFSMATHRAPK
jgi:hypothetical protein